MRSVRITTTAAPGEPASTEDDPVILRTATVRRAGPGEVGSHFDNTTDCPSLAALSAECPAAAYRHYPRTGIHQGVRALCDHGVFLGTIPAETAPRDLPYYAPFITTRETRHA